MRIVAAWYSPVLPNRVVDDKCAVEKPLDFSGCTPLPSSLRPIPARRDLR
jgi:hypothetical protein